MLMKIIKHTLISIMPVALKKQNGQRRLAAIIIKSFIYLMTIWMILGNIAYASAAPKETETPAKPWSVDLQVKYYFNSHTSYEFGNPNAPYQSPLSRLEFPVNSLWVGAEARRSFFSRFSLGIEALTNIPGDSSGAFQDSDWDDEDRPNVLTIYSESKCRMEPSYDIRGDFDLKIYDWIGLPYWLDVRPLVGIRWQQFNLLTHDGVQYDLASGGATPPESLTGDGIRFEQTYWHYFLGIRSVYDIGKHIKEISRWKLLMQLDWAYVEGKNKDHHLLRAGNRLTYENTTGDAWHALLGLKADLTDNISATVIADYLKLETTGSHRLVNDAYDIDYSFNHGVKVWSEQMSITVKLEYRF
jgi:hypothetical protein